jgi:hypothetical protein
MTDFEPIQEPRLYNRWDDPDYAGEDFEFEEGDFDVSYPEQVGPAWDVWAITYPWREADARKYLVHERTHNGVYWYRDTRTQQEFGMPEIELAEAHNEHVVDKQDHSLRERYPRRKFYVATGMLLFLTLILLPVAPDVIPWLWVASPFFLGIMSRYYNRVPKISYARLSEVRYDEFKSDREIQERLNRIVGTIFTLGLFAIYLYFRHHRHHH